MKHLGLFMAVALAANGAQATTPDESLEAAQKRLEQAQERLNESAREVANLSLRLYGPDGEATPPMPPMPGAGHPMLGISIGGEEHGGEGVRIMSVSPGGPAAQAGLKANDVILGFAGKPLKADGKQGARAQLMKSLHAVPADQAVDLEYSRDGRRQSVQVTPRVLMTDQAPMPPLPPMPPLASLGDDPESLGALFSPRSARAFGAAEFVALTPGLGRYFGTDSGLLVVRAPKDARLKLEEGDVVLDIDGRVPANAAQAFRIFSSYRGGENLKLHIMRQQKRLELPVELPADGARRNAREPGRFEDFVIATPQLGGVED